MSNPFNPVTAIIDGIGDVFDGVFGNKKDKEKATAALNQALLTGKLAIAMKQIEANAQEAQHSSVFVAGWRPFAGWLATIGWFYAHILYRFVDPLILSLTGYVMPDIPAEAADGLLYGMLGIGGMRTVDYFSPNGARKKIKAK